MKILELTNYSAGGCGVWGRVKIEATLLAKKHEVRVFSSNHTKGNDEIAPTEQTLGKIKITRFPAKKIGGESFMEWDFTKEALAYKPDIIIAHSYRHPHTTKALAIGKKLGAKVYLVTHAPFNRNDSRTFLQRTFVSLYDTFVGPKKLKQFTKVFAITQWEIPYLEKLGLPKENIVHIPNGINELYLITLPKTKEEHKLFYLGRISPIKSIETLIEAFSTLEDKSLTLEIYGPAEEEYLQQLLEQIKKLALEERVHITNTFYTPEEAIPKLDSAELIVLPSKSEGMPQVLIEAMARKKVVIASNNPGNAELIIDGKNGYLFSVGNAEELAQKIHKGLKAPKTIKEEAQKTAQQYSWTNILKKLEQAISS